VIAVAGAFFLFSLLLSVALEVIAPADLEPLRVTDAQMRAFAAAGRFPLIEAAKVQNRPGLTMIAAAQTFAAFAYFAMIVAYFARRGFRSPRLRGWSNAVWIAGIGILCFTPAVFPFVNVHTIDYAITSSETADAPDSSLARRAKLGGPLSVVYGAEGLNRNMEPGVFLAERGLIAALVAAFLAVCAHDLGYRTREALEDFGVLDEDAPPPERERPRQANRPRARAEAGKNAQAEGPSFGHRGGAGGLHDAGGSSSAYAKACALLGVRLGATHREIERAYRVKMKRAHPDHGGTAERAAALNAARDTLLGRK
jgi:hypothetical protein